MSQGQYFDFFEEQRQKVAGHYDRLAPGREKWIRHHSYYYEQLREFLRFHIPPGKRVLDVGCGTGHLLDSVSPSRGVGIDISAAMVATACEKLPTHTFRVLAAERVGELQEKFDYVMAVNTLGEIADLLAFFRQLQPVCTSETRIVLVTFNFLWAPILKLAERLDLRFKSPEQNWLSLTDLQKFLHLEGFEVVRDGVRMLAPVYIPLFSRFLNGFLAKVPPFHWLGCMNFAIVRLLATDIDPKRVRVSVVVPCKNEEENVLKIVPRIPEMGESTEIILVNDMSTDETDKRMKEVAVRYPSRRICVVQGKGEGKGAAVREGFRSASGDIYMILDADMTVMPEDLPRFFEAIAMGKGEFINGCRMIYPMERGAMRTANIIGNKVFALIFSYLLEQSLKDTLCGTKAVLARDYQKLINARSYFHSNDLWGDYDWILGAAKHSLKIVELPVHYLERTAGVTKMAKRLRNASIMFRMCWVAFIRLRMI